MAFEDEGSRQPKNQEKVISFQHENKHSAEEFMHLRDKIEVLV